MAPTKAAAKPAAPAQGNVKKKPVVKRGKPRNYELRPGLYRFSRTRMYHKTAKYKFIGKKNPKPEKQKKPTTIEKTVGGDKNGGKRIVLLKKRRNYYPTAKRVNKHPAKKSFKQHTRYTRKSLVPGTILILLAGRHKGKRVVLLKVLASGLLLVTGPFKINACPMRRIHQNYVIATSTRLDLSKVPQLETLTDEQFKRTKPKRPKKEEGDIFAAKKVGYKVSEQRKKDQALVDNALLAVIKAHPDKNVLIRYLKSMFGLKKTQYPHRLKF